MYVAEKKRDRLARCAALKTVAFNCKNSVSWCVISVGKMTCMKVVKSEGEFDYSFLRNEDFCYGNGSTFLLSKVPKTTKLFEFILDILSDPRYSSVISWEGTNGQFAIKRPDQVACLWGERNGRTNMTYQKFSRALRYYYHKKVVTKIPGRNCVYKFNFPELENQYGYHSRLLFPATTEPSGIRGSCEIPATCANHIQNPNSEYHFPATREFTDNDSYEVPAPFHSLQHPNTANASVAGKLYSVRSPVVVRVIPHESQSLLHSPSCPNPRYFHYY